MNEQIRLVFKPINNISNLVETTGELIVNVLLDPFYCTEADVSAEFLEPDSFEYIDKIREIIFNGSIAIDNLISLYASEQVGGITPEQLFRIKRDYVICYSVYSLGNIIYLDYLKSSNKSKFLGDVKVTLSFENDPTTIRDKSKAAKDCMDSIERLFQSWGNSFSSMRIFVKGESNSSSKSSSREWWWNMPYQTLSDIPIGATKHINPTTNTLQKIGSVRMSYYGQF